jgi:hypothetical protein
MTMSETFKLGDIVSLVSNTRKVSAMLDGAEDVKQVRAALVGIAEDPKSLLNFMVAVRSARRASDALAGASLSFVGGAVQSEEPKEEPSETEMELSPVPSRARRAAKDPKERKRVMGDEGGDDDK